jgi:2-C-methyl-D-erythritol 4-phosphate cytidylyltransferase/2-C-methyl-D-erythritol 2,4-cyclodiphosphate synthase
MTGEKTNPQGHQQQTACAAVIVAAGGGVRFGGEQPKQFMEVGGKTVLRHCLEVFLGLDELQMIVVVVPADSVEELRHSLAPEESGRVSVAAGGETRQDSVLNGLDALDGKNIQVVAIHDAARPLVGPDLVRETLRLAAEHNCGAIACAPVQDTVKRVSDQENEKLKIETTVSRERLWLAQTPQSFPLKMILEAHCSAREQGFRATDDSAVCERLGIPVYIVPSDAGNIKITTQSDLPFLEYKLRRHEEDSMRLRVGEGYDVHRLAEGRPLVLGGVTIPHGRGLLGHSDADVLLHAVADSLLGAAAMGDIGKHFPDTDQRYKGADSAELLGEVVSLLGSEGFQPYNVDATVIAQSPKLAPYIEQMRLRIAGILLIPVERVSVKATTHEGIGSLGRAEGIAAKACALIRETG